MTNREHLRQMTDEELAEWLCYTLEVTCYFCPGAPECMSCKGIENGLVEWLKAEAEEEE